MSTTPSQDPFQQQQQPPVIQQAYTTHSGHGSVGPVIGVLAVIMVLGAIAVMIGRICSGRAIMGHGQYDFEGWVETKCSSCIDGRVGPTPPPAAVAESSDAAAPPTENPTDAMPPQEMRKEETSQRGEA